MCGGAFAATRLMEGRLDRAAEVSTCLFGVGQVEARSQGEGDMRRLAVLSGQQGVQRGRVLGAKNK